MKESLGRTFSGLRNVIDFDRLLVKPSRNELSDSRLI